MMKQNENTQNNISVKTRRIALLGMLFALAIVLSILENLLPVPTAIPGIRLGMSNIVVMFALFNIQKRDALAIVVLKSVFVLITRGTIAGVLSLCGGLFSLGIMILLLFLFADKITYLVISIAGAVFHNIGQIAAASIILQTLLWVYLPVLLISGIITGFATSILLKLISPVFLRLRLNK